MTRVRTALRATCIATSTAAAIVWVPLLALPCTGWFAYGAELSRIDLAVLCAVRERLAAGAPLGLSPLLGNGGPLLARPDAGLFYPPRWLALALPPDWGVAVEVALHLSVAAAATAWLARTFGLRVVASIPAGVAFAWCGTALDLLRLAHYLVAAAWLPVIWAGARVVFRRRSPGRGLTAVFLGASGCLLGAEPQAFLIGAGVVNTFNTQAAAGTYTAVYSYTNSTTGGSNSTSTNIVVNVCTGIELLTGLTEKLTVYPNPATEYFVLNGNISGESLTVNIYDVTGKIIISHSTSSNQEIIDISELAKGTYFVEVLSQQQRVYKTNIVKQ